MGIKNTKGITKASGQIYHARTRFKRYYHERLSQNMRRTLKRIIETGSANLITEDRENKIYEVSHKDKIYNIVYNPQNKRIITFLPPDKFN